MCEVSWNLGLWRGANGCARITPLAQNVCLKSYLGGFDYGRDNAKLVRQGF